VHDEPGWLPGGVIAQKLQQTFGWLSAQMQERGRLSCMADLAAYTLLYWRYWADIQMIQIESVNTYKIADVVNSGRLVCMNPLLQD
jgi:hypothetical protein